MKHSNGKISPTSVEGLDTGCEVNPVPGGCLSCPLPLCRYDDTRGFINWQKRQQRAKAKAVSASGNSRPLVTEMAVEFGIKERQVYRIVARERRAVGVINDHSR